MQSQFNGELLDAMRRGSDSAWADAYDILAGDLRSYIGRLGAQSPDDVLGETMVQLVRDMKKFRGSPNEFRPWAFTVARHRVLDDARKRARRPQHHRSATTTRASLRARHARRPQWLNRRNSLHVSAPPESWQPGKTTRRPSHIEWIVRALRLA